MPRDSSTTYEVYERLKADLMRARFVPGERIRISDICKRMGVSLGAVREALSRLTSDGLVVLEPQKGFSVARISEAELHDLSTVRAEIEGQCLRRAIATGDVRWEAQILATFHEWQRAAESSRPDIDEIVRAHAAFHRALVAACDSQWLLRLREILFTQSERYVRLSKPNSKRSGVKRDLVREHREIMDACVKRNADLAVALLNAHFGATERSLVELKIVTPRQPAAATKRTSAQAS